MPSTGAYMAARVPSTQRASAADREICPVTVGWRHLRVEHREIAVIDAVRGPSRTNGFKPTDRRVSVMSAISRMVGSTSTAGLF